MLICLNITKIFNFMSATREATVRFVGYLVTNAPLCKVKGKRCCLP